jgi:hypothetical protein
MYPYHDEMLRELGISREDKAACQFTALGREDGEVYLAELGDRVEAVLQLVPQTWASPVLGDRLWTLERVRLSPRADPEVLDELLRVAIGGSEGRVTHLMARSPEADRTLQSALLRAGLFVAGREAISVARPRPELRDTGRGFELDELTIDQLPQAEDLARTEAIFGPLAANPRFSLEQLKSLYADLPAFYHQVPDRRMIVARESTKDGGGRSDGVLALVGFCLQTFIGKSNSKTMAEVDLLAARERMRESDFERQLLDATLGWAHRQEIQSILVRTGLYADHDSPTLESLEYEGYRTVEFQRVFLYSA